MFLYAERVLPSIVARVNVEANSVPTAAEITAMGWPTGAMRGLALDSEGMGILLERVNIALKERVDRDLNRPLADLGITGLAAVAARNKIDEQLVNAFSSPFFQAMCDQVPRTNSSLMARIALGYAMLARTLPDIAGQVLHDAALPGSIADRAEPKVIAWALRRTVVEQISIIEALEDVPSVVPDLVAQHAAEQAVRTAHKPRPRSNKKARAKGPALRRGSR